MLRSFSGTFERHVFEEVSGSGCLVSLCSRTSIDPNSDGGGRGRRGRFSRYGETVGKSRDLSERGSDMGSESSVEGGSLRDCRAKERKWVSKL